MAERIARSELYKGHRIELESEQVEPEDAGERGDAPVLRIDDQPIPYGQLPDGLYFVNDYAYDWQDDLMQLARRFVDYQAKTEGTTADEPQRGE